MASGVSAGDNGAGFLPASALLLSCGTVLEGALHSVLARSRVIGAGVALT